MGIFPQGLNSRTHLGYYPQNHPKISGNRLLNNSSLLINTLGFYNSLNNYPKRQSILTIDSIVNTNELPYNFTKFIFHHENNNIVSYDYYRIPNGEWLNLQRGDAVFNSKGNIVSLLDLFFGSDGWVNDRRETFTYDSLENNIGFLEEFSDSGKWVDVFRWTEYYNSLNKRDTILDEVWQDGKWVNNYKITSYFDKFGLIDSSLTEEWDGNTWINLVLDDNVKDYQGRDSIITGKRWNDSQWVNSYKKHYQYDKRGNNIFFLIESWNDTSWINDHRYFYSYNSNYLLTNGKCEYWINGEWISEDGIFYNNIWGEIYGFGEWATEQNIYYSITGIKEKNTINPEFRLSQNYPNPFNPSTIINYSISTDGFVQIKVFNILGKEVRTLVNEFRRKGNYEARFDGSGLASGVYFYRIQCGSYIQTKKMIIQK